MYNVNIDFMFGILIYWFLLLLTFCLLLEACLEHLFPNGHIEPVVNTTFTPGTIARVSCDIGFKPDSLHITCNTSRLWNPLPTCTIVTCPVPVVSNGIYRTKSGKLHQDGPIFPNSFDKTRSADLNISNTTKVYMYNTTIQLVCNLGYEVHGPPSFTCLANGTWGQHIAACVKILCNDTVDVQHEAVLEIPDLNFNETGYVSFDAEQFFLADGSVEVECAVNGKLKWKSMPTFGKH